MHILLSLLIKYTLVLNTMVEINHISTMINTRKGDNIYIYKIHVFEKSIHSLFRLELNIKIYIIIIR